MTGKNSLGRPSGAKKLTPEAIEDLVDPSAPIPGMDEDEREAVLRASTTASHMRGVDDAGRLTIDGVPVERIVPADEGTNVVLQGSEPAIDPEQAAKNNRALLASLKVAGYVNPELAGIAEPDAAPIPSEKEIGGKKPFKSHAPRHVDNSRQHTRDAIASRRGSNVEPPSRGR